MRSGSALVTETIGGRSPRTEIPRLRATSVPAAPISWASASSSTSRAPPAFTDSTPRTPCECPATVTGGVATRSMPCRASARTAAIWVSNTPGTDTAADVRCFFEGTGSSAASARTHCSGSKPIGRTTTSSLATGSSSSSTSPTSVANSVSIPAEETSSSRVSSQALPWPPNATAYGSPEARRSTRACVLCGPFPSRLADTRSCSWIVTFRISLCASLRISSVCPVSTAVRGSFDSASNRSRKSADRCVAGRPVGSSPYWVERRGGLHRLY